MTYEITRNTMFDSFEIRFDGKPCNAVRDALKALKFRWHGVKKIWYGFAASEDVLRDAIDGANVESPEIPEVKVVAPKTDKAAEAALKAEYIAIWVARGESEYWAKWHADRVGTLVKLSDGSIVNIAKPSIETRFCFGESGYDFDEACERAENARTNENYFRAKNLRKFKEWIDDLSGNGNSRICITRDRGIAEIYRDSGYGYDRDGETISDADRALMLDGYKRAYAAFEKRINAYLKRYGLSKVHTWTYWLDA